MPPQKPLCGSLAEVAEVAKITKQNQMFTSGSRGSKLAEVYILYFIEYEGEPPRPLAHQPRYAEVQALP